MKPSKQFKLRGQFIGKIYEDSQYKDSHWRYVFDGRCSACMVVVGLGLELSKEKWNNQKPPDEEIDQAMTHSLMRQHQCRMALSDNGIAVARGRI